MPTGGMAEAEDKHATRRAQLLAESLHASNTPGFGYFGVGGSLAIGDNSYSPKAVRKPVVEGAEPQWNMKTAPLRKGAGPDVCLGFMTPLCLGDPYVDPHKLNGSNKVTMLDPEAAFRPPGNPKQSTNKLGYEYVPHCDSNQKDPKEVREKYRDYMPPRQILTNAAKKGGGGVLTGGVLFGFGEKSFPEHGGDDYDAPKKQRAAELKEHKSKLQEMPFRGSAYGNVPFGNNVETFNSNGIPTHIPREPEAKKPLPEVPFRPSHPAKKGALHGCMNPPPEYIDVPAEGGAVRKPPPEKEPPPPYKIGSCRRVANPMPSVVTNLRNMRNERPASFMRPSL